MATEETSIVFSAPVADADQIIPGLWVGSAPPIGYHVSHHGFSHLVLTAQEYQPWMSCWGRVSVIHAPFDDNGTPMKKEEQTIALRAGIQVARAVRNGYKVLSTCHMGLNRSSLVAAIAMVVGLGHSPDQAVQLIRAARGKGACRNRYFDHYLRTVAEEYDQMRARARIRAGDAET